MITPRPTNLREFPARAGIVINWTHLRDLMKQYLDVRGEDDDEQVLRQIALSDFLFWLKDQQRQEATSDR